MKNCDLNFSFLKGVACGLVLLVGYSGQSVAQTVVDETTSVVGSYTVVADGQVTITIVGADGGDGSNTTGGEGATVEGVFDVTAGQVISYVVGAAGETHNGSSAGGGGSTGVFIDSTLVLVAGAGGGGDNSVGAVGLGGNAIEDGDSGTGGGPGAGGTNGNGGGAGGTAGADDSGGGGGIFTPGGSGAAGGGAAADLIPPLSFASGGAGFGSGSDGGQGFTGGGGGDSFYSGGGGGYSGGGGAGANGSAGGGGSFVDTAATGYVSSTLTAGGNGAGTESDGSILVVFASSCPTGQISNTATVSAFEFDDDLSNNTDQICTEVVRTDFGDAPASYGDASHTISSDLFIGAVPADVEVATQGNDGLGDDVNGIDDEEGLVFRSPAQTNNSIFADVVVTNTTGGNVTVCGWLDIPSGGAADGDFLDAGEGQCQTTAVSTTLTFQWSALPEDQSYDTFARFRVTSDALDASSPFGATLSDGEVEDYPVQFDFTPTVATIGTVELDALSIIDFLAEIGVAQMDQGALFNLLQQWDPARAAGLFGADQQQLLIALLDFLDPDLDGQVAVLRWDTLEERGTIGFYVERQIANGEWERVNNDMMPGLVMAPMGGEYMLADPGAQPGAEYQYQLIEQEANGNTRVYGPYRVEMP